MANHIAYGERQHGELALKVGLALTGEMAYEIHAVTEDAIAFNELCGELKMPEVRWFPPISQQG